jgi:hypothetical protein
VSIIKTSDGKVLSYTYVHVHVKCALYLSDLIQDWNVLTECSRKFKMWYFTTIHLVGVVHCSMWRDRHTDGMADRPSDRLG